MSEKIPHWSKLWYTIGYIIRHGVLVELDQQDAQTLVQQLCRLLEISPTVKITFVSYSNGTLAIEQIDQGQATSYDICRLVVALFDLSYAAGDFDPSGPPMGLVWCPFKKVVDYYHDGFTELQYRSLNLYDAAMMLASAIKIVQQ